MDTTIYNCKIIWISFILFLIACPVNGQLRKTRQMTPADYGLWSTLKVESISDYGKWVSYSLSYESGMDTLFVKSTVTSKTFAFAKGNNGKFIGDKWFGCLLAEQNFRLLNLASSKMQDFGKIQEFAVADGGQYIILYCHGDGDKMKLVIQNLNGEIMDSIEDVSSFTMNPKCDAVGYCVSNANGGTVGLISFGKKLVKSIITGSEVNHFQNVVWQTDGRSLAFVSRAITAEAFSGDAVLFYRLQEQKLFQYDTTTALNWPKDMALEACYIGTLGISNDGKRVFFNIRKKTETIEGSNGTGIQIWNAADKDLFSYRDSFGIREDDPRLAAWWPDSGRFLVVGDNLHPSAFLNGDQQFALVYNDNDNKPTWKQAADRDYYLTDLSTGSKSSFLKKQLGTEGYFFFSPGGKYILYFRDRNWWVYSIAAQTHTNITKKSNIAFYNKNIDEPEEPQPYGNSGWYSNDQSFLIYDQFDIWEFSPDGGSAKRLTRGREKQLVYRVEKNSNDFSDGVVAKSKAFEANQSLIVKAKAIDNSWSGYFTINKNEEVRPIIYTGKLVTELHKARKSNAFIFLQEDFNEPPALLLNNNSEAKIIFKSNLQHYQYSWGKSELIEYKDSKGTALKGVLCYPFDYDPKKRYPMVVDIYQRQTVQLHTYTNPSLLNGSAFNATNFTSQGYFVLYPDIAYEIGNPGFSATDCVIAATNTAIEIAPVDKTKIGLIGHSYGGYETDFIITQTNMFAVAVAGAALTDMTSAYLSENVGNKNSNGWRFEYQQFRMNKTLFEDFNGYQKNSPINGVSRITTPLLSYTGSEDTQVNPYQTMEFYHALRRLQKEHIMIVYPKENHVIQGHENQIDLTNKISEWFGYYLKDGEKPKWFAAH